MAFADVAVAAFGGDLLGGAALDAGIGAAADWGGAATLADGVAGKSFLDSLTPGQKLGKSWVRAHRL